MTVEVAQKIAALPLDEPNRSFDHPWQAQAFAMIVEMHKGGMFTWPEWVELFSTVIKANPALKGESSNDTYYRQWMIALEKMVGKVADLGKDTVDERVSEWRQAYLNTPHGQPIVLSNATCPPAYDHHQHTSTHAPVAISPAINVPA